MTRMIQRILLIMTVPLLSVVFSLMSSGIENVITANNPRWRTIPIFYWLAIWAVAWYSIYHFKFGSPKKLKMYLLRFIVRARISYLAQAINKPEGLDKMQRKAVAIWSQMLMDKGTAMVTCVLTSRRMMKKGPITCVISVSGDVNFRFMKAADKDVYFDVFLPNPVISDMFNSFDKEQKIRFEKIIEESRELVTSAVSL